MFRNRIVLKIVLLDEFMLDLCYGLFLILAVIIAVRKGWLKSALEILFGPF